MSDDFEFIVRTISGLTGPSVAIAASRAGGLGVLDLEFSSDPSQDVQRLARYARNGYGLRVRVFDRDPGLDWLRAAPAGLAVVIASARDGARLAPYVSAAHERGARCLIEVTSAQEAAVAEELRADGVIAMGFEGGGFVGTETTFVLLQHLRSTTSLPVYARGGVGLHTVAACYVAGAAGVVLDAQLALTRESLLPEPLRERIASLDGSEAVCLGAALGMPCRLYAPPGSAAMAALQALEDELAASSAEAAERAARWEAAIRERVAARDEGLLPVGQDIAFAASLARRFGTVGGVLQAFREAVHSHIEEAARLRPLDVASPLAQAHGTRYPIVQGPMTRVSDNVAFAKAVADAGGLPFLALALMSRDEVRTLLEEARRELGERPWGVGILGFVPQDVRREQMEVIRQIRPRFALIAGGRPDQAAALEREGIATYLHVPSPDLLRLFLSDGARRFIFEGRECGGHVGPRSSFVLWESAVDLLLGQIREGQVTADECHVLFAGGIHDATSAAMVAALAAPLAAAGVRVGVLMGTAYLFTTEAVATGAITARYQLEAVRGQATVELETGLGHVTRCLPTPFVETFLAEKRRLQAAKVAVDKLREELEALNLGRLRMASKGIARNPDYGRVPDAPKFVPLDEEEQYRQGLYMIGQVAALRERVCSMAELHQDVSEEGTRRLLSVASVAAPQSAREQPRPSRIAIVGMACILPGAHDLQTYWENILNKVDAVTEIPRDRFDWRRYFDPDRNARDKIYSRWGGFIDPVPFDPLDYGMPPNSVTSIDPSQLLILEVTRAALRDAGYLDRPFPRERTAVVVAAGGGLGDLGFLYGFRSYLPHFLAESSDPVIERFGELLPEWTEDSFPGILLNVLAGRVANRFDIGGPNFIVDAACGSSLAAVDAAIKDLETGRVDMAIVGAVDTVQSPFAFLAFSKTHALSPTGRCRPFDAEADGIAISEGVAVIVLKRLEDAERDGDRIYAVIQGVGASSDGRDKGLTAPRPAGQLRALRRAYEKAGISPSTVSLIEAHGTGTRVGDVVEVEALTTLFQGAEVAPGSCAIGSVKSMIGHTKSTAGLAGLIKVALALYHKVLPPTLIDRPNPGILKEGTPFYVNSEPRPWLPRDAETPRRAGVSAFGFGGTNFHAVLEEYRDEYLPPPAPVQRWPAELCLFAGADRAELLAEIDLWLRWLESGDEPPLRDVAYTSCLRAQARGPERLSIVASSVEDLRGKLAKAREALSSGSEAISDPQGAYFVADRPGPEARLAFLFPGQGSQYVGMARDLALYFPRARAAFELANATLRDRLPRPLSDYIFPPPAFSEEEAQRQAQALTDTRVAQPALGAASLAVGEILASVGLRPAALAGHSYGELVALCWAGVFSREDLFRISEARGRFMAEATGPDAGAMAAVWADRAQVAEALGDLLDPGRGSDWVTLANMNSPRQTVISGTTAGVEEAISRLSARKIRARKLPVACAFHSPLVEPAQRRLAEFLREIEFHAPKIVVYSNTHGAAYPTDPEAIRDILSVHLARPVEFVREVEAMYADGARIFVEVGAGQVLTGLVRQILGERAHMAVPTDARESGLLGLLKAAAQLAAAGVALEPTPLFEGRGVRRLDLTQPYRSPERDRYRPTTWLVSGGRARPWRDGAEDQPWEPLRVRLDDAESSPAAQPSERAEPPVTAPTAAQPGPGFSPGRNDLAAGAPPDDEAAAVMLEHQRLMSRFLEAQKRVMLAFLGDGARPPTSEASATADAVSPAPQAPTARPEQPASPTERDEDVPVEPGDAPVAPPPTGDKEPEMLTADAIRASLLSLVSERTGYPVEMLSLDANLEGDLGIDSIKRVEILGALRQVNARLDAVVADHLEELQSQRTLRGIVEALATLLEGAATTSQAAQAEQPRPRTDGAGASPIRRYLLELEAAGEPTPSATLAPGRVILVTDDGRGIAAKVVERLKARGQLAVLLARGAEKANGDRADLADPAAVRSLLDEVRRQHGPIGGIWHLAPLTQAPEWRRMSLPDWQSWTAAWVESFFLLIQAAVGDLEAAVREGGASLLVATGLGGEFGLAPGGSFCPLGGGPIGLAKTAAQELAGVRVKAVDFAPGLDEARLADILVAEGFSEDGIEVGWDGGRRRLRLREAALPEAAAAPDWGQRPIILATGGARGITALVLKRLARSLRPRLVLIGRSPLPPLEESLATAGLTEAVEIKRALIEAMTSGGQAPQLAEVERAYRRLLAEREIRSNLAELRSQGAEVEYHALDARDERALGELIDDLYDRYGRIDAVIHGAGLIEDRLLKDKSLESFRRVVRTKVDAAFTLARKLRPESLRFLAFFSSVSARFGNIGQGDYAAANEILNKLAQDLDRRWPGRVVSVNWGPWDAPGMVSEELRREFARRGVGLIPADVGVDLFWAEMVGGVKGQVEVVICDEGALRMGTND